MSFLFFVIPDVKCQETCDTNLTASASHTLGYQSRGNLCEGFYVSNQSDGKLQLCSFTQGKIIYNLSKNGTIEISATDSIKGNIKVRATSVPINNYYRMDAILMNAEPVRWSMSHCLYDKKLDNNTIGIYGYILESAYIPVVINKQSGLDPKYYVDFRSSVNLEDFKIKTLKINGEKVSFQEQDVEFSGNVILRGNKITCTLDDYLKIDSETKEIVIKFKAREHRRGWLEPIVVRLIIRN